MYSFNSFNSFNPLGALALGVAAASAQAVTLGVVPNWNLLGYSDSADVVTADAFGNANNVSTVWKWNPATSGWAFYSPSLADGGKAYAASKGYEFLTTIKTGDGFWVNAKAPFSVTLPGSAVPSPVTPVANPDALTGITATLNAFYGLFATRTPTAGDPKLFILMDASLLSGGVNKSDFVMQMLISGNDPGIGAKLGNVVLVHPTDVGAAANDATHQWFTFDIINGKGPNSPWLAIKNADGQWLLAGDQRLLNVYVDVQGVKSIAGGTVSYRTDFNFGLGTPPTDVSQVLVTGPGLVPATGVVLYTLAQGKQSIQPCQTFQSVNCIDPRMPVGGALYTFKVFTTTGGTGAPAYTYTSALPPTLPSAVTLPGAAFPDNINAAGSWTPGSTVTINWTLPVGAHVKNLTVSALSSNGPNLFDVHPLIYSNSTSVTFTVPSYNGVYVGNSIWLGATDAVGQRLAVESIMLMGRVVD